MLSGGGEWPIDLYEWENLVLFKISEMSEFLRNSSPHFSPEAKWVQTKQNVVWNNLMLIDIEPC
jgi:hypothetical protein